MKKNILLVDDYNIFRSGLKSILEKNNNYTVIGEVSNPINLFNSLEKNTPDVILLNLMLSPKTIISVTKKLNREYPGIPFLILTSGVSEYIILQCVINGAHGILWKESTTEQLFEAINTVISGEKFLNIPESIMTTKIIEHIHNYQFEAFDFSELSKRELEVVRLFAAGYSYKDIANKLNISPRTVESHKNNILTKLNLHSVIDIVKYAIKHGLIEI